MNNDDDAVGSGMMIEFTNPDTGEMVLIASARGLMELGWSRSDAKHELWHQLQQLRAAGFTRALVSRGETL